MHQHKKIRDFNAIEDVTATLKSFATPVEFPDLFDEIGLRNEKLASEPFINQHNDKMQGFYRVIEDLHNIPINDDWITAFFLSEKLLRSSNKVFHAGDISWINGYLHRYPTIAWHYTSVHKRPIKQYIGGIKNTGDVCDVSNTISMRTQLPAKLTYISWDVKSSSQIGLVFAASTLDAQGIAVFRMSEGVPEAKTELLLARALFAEVFLWRSPWGSRQYILVYRPKKVQCARLFNLLRERRRALFPATTLDDYELPITEVDLNWAEAYLQQLID